MKASKKMTKEQREDAEFKALIRMADDFSSMNLEAFMAKYPD